jgi:CBS domain containing-hemolysin-like protein
MHPVLYVPDSADVDEVMDIMQTQRHNLAIVVDEYGGTAGMITFEDLVEEIIGEFHDEFDVEAPAIELRGNQRLRVRGDVLIDDLNELLDAQLPASGVATIGGLVVAELGRIPNISDIVRIGSLEIRVDRVVNHGVAAVSFVIDAEQATRIQAQL